MDFFLIQTLNLYFLQRMYALFICMELKLSQLEIIFKLYVDSCHVISRTHQNNFQSWALVSKFFHYLIDNRNFGSHFVPLFQIRIIY